MADLPPELPSQVASSPMPPPIPAAPLSYAAPMPQAKHTGPLTFHQQAAKVSWIAPLIAMGLNVLTQSTGRSTAPGARADRSSALLIGTFNALLILAGFIFGIIALFGMRRHGKQRILVPALVGVSINGMLLAVVVSVLTVLTFRAPPRAVSPASLAAPTALVRPDPTQQQLEDSLTNSPGWVGRATWNGAVVVVFSIARDTPLNDHIKLRFGADRLGIDITASNATGSKPLTLNAADFSVVLKDGTTHAALPPPELFAAAPSGARDAETAYPATETLAPGDAQTASVAAFLPIDIDPAQIDHAILLVAGKPLIIPGRFTTAAEKAANLAKAEAAEKSPVK